MKDGSAIHDIAMRLNMECHSLLCTLIHIRNELHLSGLQKHTAYKLADKAIKEILYETPDATTDNDR